MRHVEHLTFLKVERMKWKKVILYVQQEENSKQKEEIQELKEREPDRYSWQSNLNFQFGCLLLMSSSPVENSRFASFASHSKIKY